MSIRRAGFRFAALAAVLFGLKLWVIGSFGSATPYWDQWDAEAINLYKPFLEGALHWSDLLAPHNEHRILTTRLLDLGLLLSNKIWSPILQMVVNAVFHVLAIVLLVRWLSQTTGRESLAALLLFSLLLFGIPYAWENTLVGFQAMFYFVLLFGSAAIWFTTTQLPLTRRWWAGVAALLLAFFSMASGAVAVAASFATALLIYVAGARRTNEQLISLAVLAALFVICYLSTPTTAARGPLAANLRPFVGGLIDGLSWPAPSRAYVVLLMYAPGLVLAARMLARPPDADDRRWFLLGLLVWSVLNVISLAYGRAEVLLQYSRYRDLYAIGVLTNFACAASLAREAVSANRSIARPAIGLWMSAVLIALIGQAILRLPVELSAKRQINALQEHNTRLYVLSGDMAHLENKPFMHIPHYDAKVLANVLDDQTIRGILPPSLRTLPATQNQPTAGTVSTTVAATDAGRLDGLVQVLLRSYPLFVLLGLLLFLGGGVWRRQPD